MPIPILGPSGVPFSGDWIGSIGSMPFGPGTYLKLTGITGWLDANQAPLGGSGSPMPKQRANGSWPIPHYMPSRQLVVQLTVEAPQGALLEATIESLSAATAPGVGLTSFTLQVGGLPLTVTGNVDSRIIPTTLDYLAGYSVAQITIDCDEPRKFAAPLSASTNLPTSTGGLTWPVTWPISWPATQVTGVTSLSNPGTATGPLTFTVAGPCMGPIITQQETGLTLAFSSSLVINAGDTLVVDCEAQTALYNGQASRSGYLVNRGWMGFAPGANTFSFNAAAYNSSALLTVSARPAYI